MDHIPSCEPWHREVGDHSHPPIWLGSICLAGCGRFGEDLGLVAKNLEQSGCCGCDCGFIVNDNTQCPAPSGAMPELSGCGPGSFTRGRKTRNVVPDPDSTRRRWLH